ncbi:MAG: TonB-dependent receptor plug domain-containing protein [Bacteroidales bacterium]|nr:TonB-dependent receptor plug domain-containing protein [Bacteroidales bacterium]
MRRLAVCILFAFTVVSAWSQVDTTGIYAGRKDSLDAAVHVGHRQGNYLSKIKPMRVEVISSEGLAKMACCNVAESFENSASVTVGYSDAVTGARQIRLLGLSGIYTQMLDESRPVMRGVAAPFGLTYMPGQWLESIQIAKGSASVVSGIESMTGQINLEHRKPTDEKPLFLSLSAMNDSRLSGDIASSLQPTERLSTVILGHVDKNFQSHDMNEDGFMDDPLVTQINLANRWFYDGDHIKLRWGVNAVSDQRNGGQPGYDRKSYIAGQPWGSDISNRLFDGYFKIGIPLRDDHTSSIGIVTDYTWQEMNAAFGSATYLASQRSAFVNLLYRNQVNEHHDFTVGASGVFDRLDEALHRAGMGMGFIYNNSFSGRTAFNNYALYGEYTFHVHEKFTAVTGLSANYYTSKKVFCLSPRMTLKFQPWEYLVFRFNGGRGIRQAMPLTDNIGVFSTGKTWDGVYDRHFLEDAWTYGGNATFYLNAGANPGNSYFSIDFFRTLFRQQLIVDYEYMTNYIYFYALNGAPSYTNTFQVDFAVEPIERFTVNITARYTDAKVQLANLGLVERPMTPRFKGVLNLQYKTNLSKWIFDFTAALNGSCRAYDYMKLKDNRTPVYPMLYAQITRRFKGIDLYVGGENLTGFTQEKVILGIPEINNFDASAVWGPLMGLRINAGLRLTIWKTN